MDLHLADKSDAALLSRILEKDESRRKMDSQEYVRDSRYTLDVLLDKLREKDIDYCKLLERIDSLEQTLNHEMAVNDDLTDKNIHLKGQIREMKQLMKVRVLPATIQHLTRKLEDTEAKLDKLREALLFAINLVPDNRLNKIHKDHLRQLHRNLF